MDRSDINDFIHKFESAYKAGKWKQKTSKIVEKVDPRLTTSTNTAGFSGADARPGYSSGIATTRGIMENDRKAVEYKSDIVSSGFSSLDDMLKSTEQLKDV